jgi:hypothetical protein
MGLSAIVHDRFPKPRMLECLLGSDAFLGIIHEDLLEKVEKLSVECSVWRNRLLGLVLVNIHTHMVSDLDLPEASSWP